MDVRQQAVQPLRTVYRPVDPGLAARIFRQMGRPYDPKAISPKESYYFNGWDAGDDDEDGAEEPATLLPDFGQRQGGAKEADKEISPWAKAWQPDWDEGGRDRAETFWGGTLA